MVEVNLGAGRTRRHLVFFVVGPVADEVRANDGDEGALRGYAAHPVVIPVEEVSCRALWRGEVARGKGDIDGPVEGGGQQRLAVAIEAGFARYRPKCRWCRARLCSEIAGRYPGRCS